MNRNIQQRFAVILSLQVHMMSVHAYQFITCAYDVSLLCAYDVSIICAYRSTICRNQFTTCDVCSLHGHMMS